MSRGPWPTCKATQQARRKKGGSVQKAKKDRTKEGKPRLESAQTSWAQAPLTRPLSAPFLCSSSRHSFVPLSLEAFTIPLYPILTVARLTGNLPSCASSASHIECWFPTPNPLPVLASAAEPRALRTAHFVPKEMSSISDCQSRSRKSRQQ